MSKELKELLQRLAHEATSELYNDLATLRDIVNYSFNEKHTMREVREHLLDLADID